MGEESVSRTPYAGGAHPAKRGPGIGAERNPRTALFVLILERRKQEIRVCSLRKSGLHLPIVFFGKPRKSGKDVKM